MPTTDQFVSVKDQVAALQDITAQDYVDSDPLDLDHLSTPAQPSS